MDGPDTADGTLVIMVCRAKHLPNRRKLDKQSPYVLLRIGSTANRTPSHFRAGQTPEWTHEIRFELLRERKPMLKLDVLDETKNDPTPVGGTEIDCLTVFLNQANLQDSGKYILDSWYDLTCNGRQAGTIYLEMTFYPSAPVLPPKLAYNSEPQVLPLAPEEDFSALVPLPDKDDDIFVSADYKKRRSLFRSLDPGSPTKNDSVFVTGDEPKKNSRFAKLKSKLRAKEPISSFWSDRNQTSSTVTEHNDLTPTMSPIDNLERLRVDIGGEMSPVPPAPPQHSDYGSFKLTPARTPVQAPRLPAANSPNRYYGSPERLPQLPDQGRVSPKKTLRKPPPDFGPEPPAKDTYLAQTASTTTSIPFSADTIGLDDDDSMPTKVFHLGQAVQLLTHTSKADMRNEINPNEIDPKYYAPSPNEKMARSWRLQNGEAQKKDYKVDLNTESTGYLGEGKWRTDRFSPSVFQRINDENRGFENKPAVPPKIPQGLSEVEYYVLEKDNYLKDINGRRL